jgi:osmotically-inducible protein OsmY
VGVPVSSLLAAVAVRRGQPLGPTNDQEIEDFIYDALELLPGSSEVDVRCESGRVTFTGTVHYKRLKRDVGEIAWAIPGVHDVHNTTSITARRRSRGVAQGEPQAAGGRKTA